MCLEHFWKGVLDNLRDWGTIFWGTIFTFYHKMLSSHFIPFCSILSIFPLLAASLPLLKGPNNLVCPKPSGLSFALQTVPRIKYNRSQSLQCQGPGTSIKSTGLPSLLSYYQMHLTLEAASGHPLLCPFSVP